MRDYWNIIMNILTLGKENQSFLGARWVELLLKLAPRRYKRQLSLTALSWSPHYFFREIEPEYRRLSHRDFTEKEFERNRSSREKLCNYVLLPYLSSELKVVDFGCGPGFLSKSVSQHVGVVYGIDLSRGVLERRPLRSAVNTSGENMLSDDYLLRIIQQAAIVFSRILGLKKSGDYADALIEIDQNLEQLLGLDGKLIRLLDEESLYRNLSADEQTNLVRLEFIADLFKEEGEILRLQGKMPESLGAFIRSLTFYLQIDANKDPSHPVEISRKVDEIIQNIDPSDLSSKTLFDLFCYFENEGKYAKAEKILIALSARSGDKEDAERELKSFYERLLEKEPSELSAQGITRKYIREKVKGLK